MSKRPLVLLIDDDEWLTAQYSRLLEQAGYSAHSVRHTLDGIEAIDRLHPDVIILDVFMPGPNGITLLHEIRSHSDLIQVPIVLCTNSASDIEAASLEAYGVRVLLDKSSMYPDDIVSSVRKVLG